MADKMQRRLTEIERALLGDVPLRDCLRMCVALGAELKSAPLRDWARQELMGYQDGAEVPSYRIVDVGLMGEGLVPLAKFSNKPIAGQAVETAAGRR
jgi:hypothetical protein